MRSKIEKELKDKTWGIIIILKDIKNEEERKRYANEIKDCLELIIFETYKM